jgi:hypothetical protein
MPPPDPAVQVPFDAKTWKKFTNQTTAGDVFSWFYRSDTFTALNTAVDRLLENPTAANKAAVNTALDAWIREKLGDSSRSMPSGHHSSATAISSRNIDGFLEEVDLWLKGLDREFFSTRDDAALSEMRANLWRQTVGNLRVKKVRISARTKETMKAQLNKAKKELRSAKQEAKEAAKGYAEEVRSWVFAQFGHDWQREAATDEEGETDSEVLAVLGEILGPFIAELIEEMLPYWGTVRTGYRFGVAAKKLAQTVRHGTAIYELPAECDIHYAQVAMEQVYQRIREDQSITVGRLAAKTAVSAAAAAGTLGLAETAVTAATGLGSAMIALAQLKKMMALAASECKQANRVLRRVTSESDLTPMTVRQLVYVCPIIGCHLIKDSPAAFLFDDFVLGVNTRFRQYAVGTVLPDINRLKEAAGHFCENSLLSLDKFVAPVTRATHSAQGKGLKRFRDLVEKQIAANQHSREMIANFQSVVVAAMLANRQAVADILKDPVPNPTIVPALDNLAAIIGEVVAAYEKTLGRYGFASGLLRNVSKPSELCLAYLKTGFPADVRQAKTDLFDEAWWSVPSQVIDALLGKPGARSFTSILSGASEIHGSSGGFSSAIGALQPLKKGSDMEKILSEQYARWRPPSTG